MEALHGACAPPVSWFTCTRVWAKTSSIGSAAFAHRPGERLGVDAVGAWFVADDRARRGVEGDELAGIGIDQREAAGERLTLAGIGIGPRRVDDQDARAPRLGGERVGEVGDPDRLHRRVGIAGELRVDGNEEIVALVLHAAAGEVDEGLHVGADRRRLVEEVAHRRAHRLRVEVARADDVEAGRLQGLGDQRGVVDRRGERLIAVGRFADHQGDARIGRRGPLRERRCGRRARQQDRGEQRERRPCHHFRLSSAADWAPPIGVNRANGLNRV